MVVWKNLYIEPRTYTFPITAAAAAGWKIVSAKYRNSAGQDITLQPPTATAATYWQFSATENPTANSPKIITVHFATLRQTPSGRPDYEEDIVIFGYVVASLATLDADNNGLYDQWEIQYFGSVAQDPYADPDKDGFSNLQEMQNGTDPLHFTDTVYTTDTDTDHNGFPDWWEMQFLGQLGNNGSTVVPNSGGLTIQQLYNYYVQQMQNSKVGDGIPDSWKQAHGIDVNDPNAANKDPDNDGLTNADEYDADLDPKKPDYDGDGIYDGEDLYPKDKNITSAQNVYIDVPSWDQISQSQNPDYTKVDYTKIELRWEAGTNGPSGYIIERRINSDAWQQIATTSALKSTDSGLLANQHYQYRITAYKTISGGKMLSEPVILDYEVPPILSLDVKPSSLTRYKQYFTEFTNPSSPPKYYLIKKDTSSYTSTSSASDGGSSASADYSYTTEVDPAAHSRKYTGTYSYTFHSSYSSNGSGSTSDSSTSSDYSFTDINRTKSDVSSHDSGSSSYHSSSSSSWWSRYDSGSSSSSSSNSGNYLSEGKYVANEGSPLWAGDDYDMSLGKITWSGNSSYTSQSSSSSGSPYSYSGQASENPTGGWSGSYSGTSGSGSLSGPPWSGGWGYWFSGGSLVSSSPTELSYTSSSSGYSAHGSSVLSKEYTTANFIADTTADLPDYPEDWLQNWYGWGNYYWGWSGYNSWGYYGGWYTYGYPWYGWWVSGRTLSKNETSFYVGKMKYRFRGSPSVPYTLKWDEVFVPEDDPDTTDVDESKNIKIINHCSWPMAQGQTTSPEFEITKATTEPKNGYYTIIIQPVHIGVSGIGEAGKDKTGDDTNPGKVVLINDGDVDNDGIPDYADGYSLSPQIEQEKTCEGASFTPIGIAFVATDPEHAKIRFTYDASDPKQVTATTDDPFKLPQTGKIRIWTTDAPGKWESGQDDADDWHLRPRNGNPVKSGGDFIKPGVDYTFADLGIDSYYSFLTCYVEAVKTSDSVADIPIRVEVDPTGSMGYVWSDQLRFTASKIEVESKGLKELPFAVTPIFQPTSLKNYYENMALFAAPAKPVAFSRIKVKDPRKNLKKVTVQRTEIPLSSTSDGYASQEFIAIRPKSGESRPMEQVQAPIIPKQDKTPMEVAGTTYNKPQLPWPIKDVKKANDETDDVIIEAIPSKTSSESDNEYIQRSLSDKQIAFIEPNGATNGIDPEMPHLVAKLPGEPSHDLKVRWKLLIEYKRGNGYRASYVRDFTRPEDTVKIPANGEYTPEMSADQEWRIFETADWTNQIAQNGFFGGTAKLYIWFPIKGAEPTEPFMTFRIGGKNPDQTKAKTFINSVAGSFWYAYAIAKHETYGRIRENGKIRFYNQFYTDYKGGPIGDKSVDMGWAAWARGWPLYNLDRDRRKDGTRYQNGPGGYGMYQLTLGPKNPGDTIPTGGEDFIKRKEIWNWQDNVRGAINELQGKLGAAQSLLNGLQSTYSQWPSIPNEGRLSGLDAIVVTYYNGTGGLPSRKVNGKSKKTPWTPEIQNSNTRYWEFHQNSQDYVQSVNRQIE